MYCDSFAALFLYDTSLLKVFIDLIFGLSLLHYFADNILHPHTHFISCSVMVFFPNIRARKRFDSFNMCMKYNVMALKLFLPPENVELYYVVFY